jgi:hypothetical protein
MEERLVAFSGDEDWIPRFNIAPTQPVPVIHGRHLRKPPARPLRQSWRCLGDDDTVPRFLPGKATTFLLVLMQELDASPKISG